jgi:hypothetical protein
MPLRPAHSLGLVSLVSLVSLVALVSLGEVGCSGDSDGATGDGARDATSDSSSTGDTSAPEASSGDASADAAPPGARSCPARVPDAGESCSAPGLWCELGGGDHGRCATRALCAVASGTQFVTVWTVFPPDPACGPDNATACPAGYGEALDASCPLTTGACDYEAGRCACAECAAADGGADRLQWLCRAWTDVKAYLGDGGIDPDADGGCAADRPRFGTPCDATFVCAYDVCYGVSLGPYESCVDGKWGMGPQTDLCRPPRCR